MLLKGKNPLCFDSTLYQKIYHCIVIHQRQYVNMSTHSIVATLVRYAVTADNTTSLLYSHTFHTLKGLSKFKQKIFKNNCKRKTILVQQNRSGSKLFLRGCLQYVTGTLVDSFTHILMIYLSWVSEMVSSLKLNNFLSSSTEKVLLHLFLIVHYTTAQRLLVCLSLKTESSLQIVLREKRITRGYAGYNPLMWSLEDT